MLLLCLASATVLGQGNDGATGKPGDELPVEVSVGFNLVNLTDVNEKQETIDFEGAIYLEWNDPSLAYSPEDYGMKQEWTPGDYSRAPAQIFLGDYAVKELFRGWRPHVVIPNGISDRATTNMGISVWPDGHIAYSETFYAKVEAPMDLRKYPFDTQDLEIFFHPFIYQRDELILVPENRLAGTWDQNMGIADWSRESVSMSERATRIAYLDESEAQISEFVVTLRIKRKPAHFMISMIFPMIVLVGLTWCIFWIDEDSLSNRINVTFIGILSVVAYYFVILDNVPAVDYLTLIDAFIIATFLILTAGVILIVLTESMTRKHGAAIGAKIDRICRWAFPLGYVMTTVLLGGIFFNLY